MPISRPVVLYRRSGGRGGALFGHYVRVLVRLVVLAALLAACSADSDDSATPRGSSTSTSIRSQSFSSTTSQPDAEPATRVSGRLEDGRVFTVRHDPVHRLCVKIDDVDFGCDDEGPVIGADADPATPRTIVEETGSPLLYGYLPDDAVAVVGVLDDGRRLEEDIVNTGPPAVWALPVPAGVDVSRSPSILYIGTDGAETAAPTL
jgi:hypothetical protein